MRLGPRVVETRKPPIRGFHPRKSGYSINSPSLEMFPAREGGFGFHFSRRVNALVGRRKIDPDLLAIVLREGGGERSRYRAWTAE